MRRAASHRCTPAPWTAHGCQCTSSPQSYRKNIAFQPHKVIFNRRSQVFRADVRLPTHLQPLHCKLPLVLPQTYIRQGMETALLYPECADSKHQPSVQCCLKPGGQTSVSTLWGHVKGNIWQQKVLRTFAFSICMNTYTNITQWTPLGSSKTTRLNLNCAWFIDT